jgi:hypothetical protein
MLSGNLPAWRYVVLVLSCVAAAICGYLNVIEYKKPLTKTQRIVNSVSVFSLIVFLGALQASTHFYSDPGMDAYMD